MKKKRFKVSIIGASYPVIGEETTTLEAVWDSQKSWMAPGTRVLIEDGQGKAQIFEREKRHHG